MHLRAVTLLAVCVMAFAVVSLGDELQDIITKIENLISNLQEELSKVKSTGPASGEVPYVEVSGPVLELEASRMVETRNFVIFPLVKEPVKLGDSSRDRYLAVRIKAHIPADFFLRIYASAFVALKVRGVNPKAWNPVFINGHVVGAFSEKFSEEKQAYEWVKLDTGIAPFRSGENVVEVRSGRLAGTDNYDDFTIGQVLLVFLKASKISGRSLPFWTWLWEYMWAIYGQKALEAERGGKGEVFVCTAYTEYDDTTPAEALNPESGFRVTATGNPVIEWYTVAADPRVIPYHSVIYIPFFRDKPNRGIFVVTDCGGAIKGKRLDIYMKDSLEARRFGRRELRVYVLKVGKGDAERRE